jgi:hypothetical protein
MLHVYLHCRCIAACSEALYGCYAEEPVRSYLSFLNAEFFLDVIKKCFIVQDRAHDIRADLNIIFASGL